MRPNVSSNNGLPLSPQQHQSRLVFDRVSRYIGRLAKSSTTNDVHRFRTNSRRVEALMGDLSPETRNKKKLLKLLSKLRKKAGKLRDLDVQIAFLKELKIPDRQNHRAQLLEWLSYDHARRSKKLAKAFDPDTVRELRKRLRRAQSEMKLDGIKPLELASGHLPKPGQLPISEKMLHACRIATKHARYLAELADSQEAKSFIEELKRAQDVIGEWHDILKLKEIAEQRFGSVHDSALVAALQNIGRARFRRAVNALLAAIAAVTEVQRASSQPDRVHKPTSFAPAAQAAVA
jgi:CHAD domain-containing protein